jgi:hypothetical protein
MTMEVSQDAKQGVDFMEVGMVVTLEEALAEAELEAVKTRTINLDQVLELARVEAQHPSVVAVWRDTDELAGGHEKVVAEHMLGAAFPASTTGGRKKVRERERERVRDVMREALHPSLQKEVT